MKRALLLSTLLPTLLLAACADHAAPPGLAPSDVPPAFEQSKGATAWPAADWWTGFGSAELAGFESQAQTANLDIAQAVARLKQADARARQAGAALLPSLGISGNITSQTGVFGGSSTSETDFLIGPSASYELDFWGKNKAAADSASFLRDASLADRATVALTAEAAVATGYFQILSLRERLAVARDNLKSAQDIMGVVQRRVDAGYAPNADLTQARLALSTEEAAIPALEQQELEARTALALLLGRAPEGFAVTGAGLEGLTVPQVAPGLPSELLRRRPDVATAEADLASAHADVAAARAAMLPDITLTANAGLQSPALNAAVTTLGGTGLALGIGAALLQSIFDGGKAKAKTEETEARQEELLAAYRATALSALGDVENALGALAHLSAQQQALDRQVADSESALRGAQRKYTAGGADFLVITDAQKALYAARDQASDIKRARLAAAVALFKALGGGWTGGGWTAP